MTAESLPLREPTISFEQKKLQGDGVGDSTCDGNASAIENNDEKSEFGIPDLSACTPSPKQSPWEENKKNFVFDENDNVEDDDLEIEKKTDEILICLNGVDARSGDYFPASKNDEDDEKVVDLWHLRELAISRHGLINSNIRKRAWTKLLGANEHILTGPITSLPSRLSRREKHPGSDKLLRLNNISEPDIDIMKRDVSTCIWNIEEEIRLVRLEQDQRRVKSRSTTMRGSFIKFTVGDDASSVASLDSGCSSLTAGRITPQLIPEAFRAFPRFVSGLVGGSVPSPQSTSNVLTPLSSIPGAHTNSVASDDFHNQSISEESNVPSIIANDTVKHRKQKKKEHVILLNIIISILRSVIDVSFNDELESDNETVVTDNKENVGNRLYYFQGMHNLIAPILITLESPSLTTFVFRRLAQSHLRDAMKPTFESIKAGIRIVFMPLLEQVDKSLHQYIVQGRLKDPCDFALPWVLCWFANDIPQLAIVSRLFDVFMASHAFFPVYLSVAMLTHPMNRSRIMMASCNELSLMQVISSLPCSISSSQNAMSTFEDMIQTALSYMHDYMPLQEAQVLNEKHQDELVLKSLKSIHTVNMMKGPPSWATVPTAPTDWTLIKQAKVMRGLSPASRLAKKNAFSARKHKVATFDNCPAFKYNQALNASGLSQSMKDSIRNPKKKQRSFTRFIIYFLLCTTSILYMIGWNYDVCRMIGSMGIELPKLQENFDLEKKTKESKDRDIELLRSSSGKEMVKELMSKLGFHVNESMLSSTVEEETVRKGIFKLRFFGVQEQPKVSKDVKVPNNGGKVSAKSISKSSVQQTSNAKKRSNIFDYSTVDDGSSKMKMNVWKLNKVNDSTVHRENIETSDMTKSGSSSIGRFTRNTRYVVSSRRLFGRINSLRLSAKVYLENDTDLFFIFI